jgi:AAA domain
LRAVAEALKRVGKEANIPVPWDSLRGAIAPLRGQLAIVLAEPGVGKSAFSLNWAAKTPGPSCVISLDTDLGTQAIRLAGILSGESQERVKQSPEIWADFLEKKAKKVRMYDLNLDSRDLSKVVEAEAEFWGQSPELVVVDNIGNLIRDGSYEEFRAAFSDLHRVARAHDTFVLALHHVRRSSKVGTAPTMASGLFSGEQEAELVLGLTNDHGGILSVSILKNRSGHSKPDGSLKVPLSFNQSTMEITDLTPQKLGLMALAGGSYGQSP